MGWARVWMRRGGVYRVLLGKPEGRRPLKWPRRRWVDNIRMDPQEVVCGYMDWIGLPQERDRWRTHVSAVMSLRVPWNAGNFLTSCKPVSFSRRTLHHGVSSYCIYQRCLLFRTCEYEGELVGYWRRRRRRWWWWWWRWRWWRRWWWWWQEVQLQ